MRIIIFSILLIVLISCQPFKVRRIRGGIDLNTIQSDSVSILRSDGLYTHAHGEFINVGERHKIHRPLILLNRKKAIKENVGSCTDYRDLQLITYFSWPRFTDGVGDYVVKNDTIWVKTPIELNGAGMTPFLYEAYFQGEIKNRDTIVNWHMIPPYPKADRKLNNYFKDLVKPTELYFIEGKELLGLDSLYQQRLKEAKGIK